MGASILVLADHDRADDLRRLLAGDPRVAREPVGARPECIVLVHEPPEADAFARLEELGGDERVPRAATVVVTRHADTQIRRALLRAGATQVVAREGLDAAALSAALDEALDRYAVLRRASRAPLARTDADEALRYDEARLRRVFETNLIGIIFWDTRGGVYDANDEFLRIVGATREDLEAGRVDWAKMTPPEHKAQDARALDELSRTGRHAPIEKECVRLDGSRVWVLVGSALIAGEHGVGFVLDISHQKDTEAAVRESEAHARESAARAEAERAILDAILEAAPAGIILADQRGKVVRANPANELLWGPAPPTGSVAEYRARKGWWADASERRGRLVEPHEWAMSRALRGETARGDIVEIEPFDRPGTRRTMLNSGAPVRDAAGRVIGAVIAQMDITDAVATEAALRDANARLKEADRRKDELLAMLAHELRNPLAPVQTAVEVLRQVESNEPHVARARDVIYRQITHMARLIDDLLEVSRIARGAMELHKERCDLAAIARQTAEDYRATLEGLGLTVDAPSAPPVWVDGDPVRLAQMIGNLLHNAGRFTSRGGRVEVRTEADEATQRAVVRVSDTGVGMEPELVARLFDPFMQAEQGLARSRGGLGLGLALTRGLAELHGGAIEARSGGPGCGSTFTVSVPLAGARVEAAPSEPQSARKRAPLRVLVVEDNHDAAETLGDYLELGGYEVRLAYDGEAAIQTAHEFEPHVVISDIGLPGDVDGYAVARALRADPALRRATLIALSGYASDEARRRSREAGFDTHLAKPAASATLERAIAGAAR